MLILIIGKNLKNLVNVLYRFQKSTRTIKNVWRGKKLCLNNNLNSIPVMNNMATLRE